MKTTKNAAERSAVVAKPPPFHFHRRRGGPGRARRPGRSRRSGYPKLPIRLVVPFAAGSGTDAVARITAQMLGEALKASRYIVDNRPGANGVIAAEFVAKARAGRLHAVHDHQHHALGQPEPDEAIALRPGEGLHAGQRMGNLPFMLVVDQRSCQ
jgi:tripartite-type tricarboxylate transporter receptor subunit TctC